MSDRASASRARQACEPCRRKKTKCPGEKPTCSFCQRLGQRCSYERDDAASARIHKTRLSRTNDDHTSVDRIHRLESKVEEILDVLSSFVNQNPSRASSSSATTPGSPTVNDSNASAPTRQFQTDNESSHALRFNAAQQVEPPTDLWPRLITIYREKFHCQPLVILDEATLSSSPTQWPKCLRHSFLSLTVPFIAGDTFFTGLHKEATSFYGVAARQEIFKQVGDGGVSLGILQSVCVSTLREILESNYLAASMSIGIGVQLALSTRIMSSNLDSKIIPDRDARNRCCWSLFVLDRMYCSTLTVPPAISVEAMLPDYPTSPECPTSLDGSLSSTSSVRDLGVLSYCLQLFSIWGVAINYVRSVKEGGAEDAWAPQSKYNLVRSRLFDFETKFAQLHRFQQTRLQDHDLETLEKHRAYWMLWLSMQFLFHAIQGLINHPFLHIASRSKRQGFQPPAFLQHSVDQAVFHSSWILKLFGAYQDKSFRINDPFIGHLVAITMTIYLFLLNAKDEDLATQARLGIDKSYSFLLDMSSDWPHLRHTIDKLNILRHAADTDSSMQTTVSGPTAQRSLLWELLDYSTSTTPSRVPDITTDAVDLNVDTRFLSPVNPIGSAQTSTPVARQNLYQAQPLDTEGMVQTEVWEPTPNSFDFNLFDNEQMADLANSTYIRDFWTFGQL